MKQHIIDKLAEQVFKHRNLYYNEEPIISDAAFDILVDELKELSPEHPAITDIGASPTKASEWKKVRHKIAMGSLDKATSPDELAKWVKDTFKDCNSIFVVEKLDGSSIECVYEDGKLIEASSRGNGEIGENITRNVIKMGGVKKKLPIPFTGSLRGEIILKKSKLAKHFPTLANARNGANGVAKRLDGEGSEHLDILFYQAIGDKVLASEYAQLKFLEELGLNVPNYSTFASNNVDALIEFVISKWNEYNTSIRNSLDWEIDGLVIRISDLKAQEALGHKHMKPVGAVAFKFPGEEKKTRIINIRPQTGNNGHITPVADVETTLLMGAEISKASIYNFHNIQEMGIDIGAEVMIKRANDVIPCITEVVIGTNSIFPTPTECPSCSGPVEMRGKHLCCISTDTCIAQKNGRILNWVSGLDILELGETLIAKLIDSNLVSNVSDLYRLTIEQLSELDRMGERSASNVYKSIWSKTVIPLETLLGSLSIPMIGSQMIKLLIDAGYDNIDKIMSISLVQLGTIKGLGPAKSSALFKGLASNKGLVYELLKLGIKIEEKTKNMSNKLNGKSFVITGKTSLKRDELRAMIEENGGLYKSAVKEGTTFLIIADPGSTTVKANNARDMGVELISEEQFLSMVV